MANTEIDNFLARDLAHFVKREAFLWGDNVAQSYFEFAEGHADGQWEFVQNFLSRHPTDYTIDYTTTLELACGRGRFSEKLANLAKQLILLDVNPENIQFVKERFPDKPWQILLNNGYDLRDIPDDSITFVFCFEAAVHFDLEIILSYLKECKRVMRDGAFCFMHHSNTTENPGADFWTRPHWRNFMSKEIFTHLCVHNGLNVVDQYVFHQGGPGADCFSLVQKKT